MVVDVEGEVGNVEMVTGPMMRELRFELEINRQAGSSRNFASGCQPCQPSVPFHPLPPCRFGAVQPQLSCVIRC